LKKSSLLLLLLVVPTSCVSFKPFVFTDAYLNPQSTTIVNYDNLNWSYALFNQFASGLTYGLRMNFDAYNINQTNFALRYQQDATTAFIFNEWNIVSGTFVEATELSPTWRQRFNTIFFDRLFDRTNKKPTFYPHIRWDKNPILNSVNLELIIKSKISYNVNVGSVYNSFYAVPVNIDKIETWITFFNKDNQLLQTFLLDTETVVSGVLQSDLYNLSTVITNVNRFDLKVQMIDTPPYTANFSNYYFFEFNIFTQNQEISIPDDADGDLFGFEFVAVEWWNFLGHAQNFLWWVINKSPISPVFVWIDTYIITWFVGFFNFMEDLFKL